MDTPALDVVEIAVVEFWREGEKNILFLKLSYKSISDTTR